MEGAHEIKQFFIQAQDIGDRLEGLHERVARLVNIITMILVMKRHL